MPKVLVIHGAGMNMRGKAQIDVFGYWVALRGVQNLLAAKA